jgi:hypothetical protein
MIAVANDLPFGMRSKIAEVDECWEWLGARNSKGYPCFAIERKSKLAHRVSYELLVGRIPDGLQLDHLCRNIICVRPSHLEPVTNAENMRRRSLAYLTCKRGHSMVAANVRVHKRANGHVSRECRECERERNRDWMRANRAERLPMTA